MNKPLAGINVVECSAVFAGPICARLLADGGADVIKIESPNGGDQTRGPTGNSRVFAQFNAGKRSIAVNLATSEGRDVVLRLLAKADVFIPTRSTARTLPSRTHRAATTWRTCVRRLTRTHPLNGHPS